MRPTTQGVRIAELVATLSYAADLGLGQPMEHSMRQAVIALRLGGLVAADEQDLAATYYLGMMMNAYCHVDAREQASWFGDDIAMKADMFELLGRDAPLMVAYMLRRVGSHGTGLERARRLATLPVLARKMATVSLTAHSTLGAQMAGRMGLAPGVQVAISQAYEQWDGKGLPRHLRGEEVCLAVRLVQVGAAAEVFGRRHGVEAAVKVVRKHRGTQFDPAVADAFCAHAPQLLEGLDEAATWDAILDAEPRPTRSVVGADLDVVLEALADGIDLKCPYLAGHSRGVANLAAEAGSISPSVRWLPRPIPKRSPAGSAQRQPHGPL